MKLRAILFAILAIVVALGTMHFAQNWLNSEREKMASHEKKAPPPELSVLVAARDLQTGSFIRKEDMRWQTWPDGNIPDTYLREGKDSEASLLGSVVRQHIAAGEPINTGLIIKPGDRGFLAAVLNPGMRAVSVSVSAITGVAGLVFPGDRVDLVMSYTLKPPHEIQGDNHFASETVLRDLRVLAVDQTTDDPTNKPVVARTMTLEVSPKQAEIVQLAAEFSKLSVSLRSLGRPDDEAASEVADSQPTYTLDSDISPLIRSPQLDWGEHKSTKSGAPVHQVTVLRGVGGEDSSGSSSAAPPVMPVNPSPAFKYNQPNPQTPVYPTNPSTPTGPSGGSK